MNTVYLHSFEQLIPTLCRDWEGALLGWTDAMYAGVPPGLTTLMEEILHEVRTLLRARKGDSLLIPAPADEPLWAERSCGVVPLAMFLVAGRTALEAALDRIDQQHANLDAERRKICRERISTAFDLVAHCQMNRTCGSCEARGDCPRGDRPHRVTGARWTRR